MVMISVMWDVWEHRQVTPITQEHKNLEGLEREREREIRQGRGLASEEETVADGERDFTERDRERERDGERTGRESSSLWFYRLKRVKCVLGVEEYNSKHKMII